MGVARIETNGALVCAHVLGIVCVLEMFPNCFISQLYRVECDPLSLTSHLLR